MKKSAQRIISVMLTLALLISSSVSAFAAGSPPSYAPPIINDVITFTDSNGVLCSITVTIDQTQNIVTTESTDAQCVFNLNDGTVVTEKADGTTTQDTFEPQTFSAPQKSGRASATLWGTVKYKPVYDDFGGVINDSLKIYATNNGTVYHDYVINGEQYDNITQIIGYFVSYLVGLGMSKWSGVVAEGVFDGLATNGILKLVDYEVKKAFTTTVKAQNTYYTTEAIDPNTNRSFEYDGSMHKVTSAGANYNQTYYEEIYPQFVQKRDNSVAYWLYSDFYAYIYPGVKSYS